MNFVIKTAPSKTLSVPELIVAQAFLGVLNDRIKGNGHEVPQEYKQELNAVSRELDERLQADREKQLAVLQARRANLMTMDEKRKALDDEIAKLNATLNPASVAAAK